MDTVNSIVVFFDIYGFSEQVAAATQLYNHHYSQVIPYNKTAPELIDSLQRISLWIREKIVSGGTNAYLFSDCGYLVYSVPSGLDAQDIVIKVVQDLETLMDRYLDEGFLLRGGIACGETICRENFLIGNAIIEAHRIESSLCPGPFILFPSRELRRVFPKSKLINVVAIKKLTLKGGAGKMNCSLIFPQDKYNYIQRIAEYAEYFLDHGPPQFGLFWDNTHTFLIETFRDHLNLPEQED